MPQTAIFTIVSANYIAFAATLMQSLRKFQPHVARFIILSDAIHEFGDLDLAAEVVGCEYLDIELLTNMQMWYSVIEFNTAIKPFTFRHMFETRGFQQAIYLDPDIQLYAPLDEIFRALEDHSLVLTPHMTLPLQDKKNPSDLSIIKAGVYNLGFAAVKNDPDGCRLISWWCDRLFAHCRVDIPGNLFTDQRWMDLAPAFVARTFLLRHHSYNVAYWNIVHRTVTQTKEGEWQVDGAPLVFYHFSGIKPDDSTVFSKHQDRFTIATLGPVAKLCEEYRARVLNNGWHRYSEVPYAFGKFEDGSPILDTMRRWILHAIDDGKLDQQEPLSLSSHFFEAPDGRTFANDGRLTRFAYQVWRDRPDLQQAFNLHSLDGFNGFIDWFCGGSAEREGVSPTQVQAVCKLHNTKFRIAEAPLKPLLPPWTPLSTDAWAGSARDAAEWLQGETEFLVGSVCIRLQRQAALLWELRTDIQNHFRLENSEEAEAFQSWAITEGMRQGSIRADLLTQEYMVWFDSPASISRLYAGAPISRGMALTRKCATSRNGMEAWNRFPLDERARVEQAFWFAFLAPSLFCWPAGMTASVRAYFDSPSEIGLDGYRFSRGMLAPHQIREDIHRFFDLEQDRGRWAYLGWLLNQGAREFGIDPAELCPGLSAFMSATSQTYPTLSRWAEFAHDRRDDLKAAFDLSNPAKLADMERWERTDLVPWLISIELFDVLVPPHPSERLSPAPHRCLAVLSGDWSTTSGLGEDLRMAVAALKASDFHDYIIVDLATRKITTPNGQTLEAGMPVEAQWNVVFHNADTALDDWNTLRELRIDAKRTAGRWHWELERIPARWIHAFSFVDEVWAPSRFVMSVFEVENRRPTRLLHHAVVAPPAQEIVSRQALGLQEEATVFFFMFDFSSFMTRKNPAGVINAFLQAFPQGDERVQLVIKTQNAEVNLDRWKDLVALTEDPRVVLKNARLSRDELVSLVSTSDAFVSLHRSEGFGRGPAEAMLLGVPVIVTNYSGNVEFADASCACMVGFTMVPVGTDEYPGVEGQFWADPDIGEATHWMRWVHDEPNAAHLLGQSGRQRAADLLSPRKMATELLELLNRVEVSTITSNRTPAGTIRSKAQAVGRPLAKSKKPRPKSLL